LCGRASGITAEWDGLDVPADECVPFGAVAEADVRQAERRAAILIRIRLIERFRIFRPTVDRNPVTLVTPNVRCPALIFLATIIQHVASRTKRARKRIEEQ
jgi:hypothetical protein